MVVARRWAIVVVLALAACSGGGDDDPADEGTQVGSLDGMKFDIGFGTELVGIGGGRFAFAQGLTPVNGDRRFTITVGSQASMSRWVTNPWDIALADADAWWTGEEVVVVGLRCPKVDMVAMREDEEAGPDFDAACGPAARADAYAFDPASGRWRVVARDLPSGSRDKPTVRTSHGTEAVLETLVGFDGREYRVLDSRTGALERLPDLPAFASHTLCLGPHGLLAVGTDDDIASDDTMPTTTRAFVLSGEEWNPLDMPSEHPLVRFGGRVGCDPDGGFTVGFDAFRTGVLPRWRHVAPDELRSDPVTLPLRGQPGPYEVDPGATAAGVAFSKFGPFDLRVYRSADDGWREIGSLPRPYPPDDTVVSGAEVGYTTGFPEAGVVHLVDP